MIRKLKIGWLKKHKIIFGLLLVFIIILGLSIYQAVALRINKHNFEQARAAIDTIYADIVTKVGPPDNYKRSNQCSRTSQEFGEGPLSCNVSTEFIYGVKDQQQANLLFKQLQSIIKSKTGLLTPTSPLPSSITSKFVVNTYFHTAIDKYQTNDGMACAVKYVYDTPLETPLKLNALEGKKVFYTILDCYGEAKTEFYRST